jgi:hypothetical protein
MKLIMQFSPASCYFQLDQNIPLNILLSSTLSLCSSVLCEKKSHTHTKQQAKLQIFYSASFYDGSRQYAPRQNIDANLKICKKSEVPHLPVHFIFQS